MPRERLNSRADDRDEKPRRSSKPDMELLEEGLEIDEHALDDALISQPGNFYATAKELALAVSRRDAASQNVKVEEANADARIRDDAGDGKKPSEAQILQMIKADPEVIKARAELLEREEQVAMLSALKEAFTHRSYALKDLVSLHLASYYSNASDVRSDHQAKDIRSREAKARMREARAGSV